MAWTQEDLDRLNEMVATGARSVSINGETTVFRTMDEVNAIRLEMQQAIDAASGGKSNRKFNFIRPRARSMGYASARGYLFRYMC